MVLLLQPRPLSPRATLHVCWHGAGAARLPPSHLQPGYRRAFSRARSGSGRGRGGAGAVRDWPDAALRVRPEQEGRSRPRQPVTRWTRGPSPLLLASASLGLRRAAFRLAHIPGWCLAATPLARGAYILWRALRFPTGRTREAKPAHPPCLARRRVAEFVGMERNSGESCLWTGRAARSGQPGSRRFLRRYPGAVEGGPGIIAPKAIPGNRLAPRQLVCFGLRSREFLRSRGREILKKNR